MFNNINPLLAAGIGFLVFLVVAPIIMVSIGSTENLQRAGCELNGERFASVIAKGSHANADDAWNASGATAITISANGANCQGLLSKDAPGTDTVGPTTTYYTPAGRAFSVAGTKIAATADANANITGGVWSAPAAILGEQSQLNNLMFAILPIAFIGVLVAIGASWYRGRGMQS